MNIVWLAQVDCQDPNLVGSKAANLSRLYVNYPVPPGFCLTVASLSKPPHNTQSDETPSGSSLSPGVLAELAMAYGNLSRQCGVRELAVAVRSSAVDEDTPTASFAGQHETSLNVIGIDAIGAAAMRCLMSARSTGAMQYRSLRGLSLENPRFAVLVQEQVIAESSAVVFSVDPLTGRDEIIVNSNWGLGKSIVEGLVNPDSYTVRRSDLKIVKSQVATKHLKTIACSRGTREVELTAATRNASALSDHQVVELARLAIKLEKTMGWPVDVECAYEQRNLFLLQCRPLAVRNDARTIHLR